MINISDCTVEIKGIPFKFVQELSPERDGAGQVKQFVPQDDAGKYAGKKLNKYGGGSFCRFSISSEWAGCCGVYALFTKEKLLYIGECQDLSNRFNSGYGYISFRNCLHDGQSTNCKINAMILRQYLGGNKVCLYFFETEDYKRIENVLLSKLTPPYNGNKTLTLIPVQAPNRQKTTRPAIEPIITTGYMSKWLKVVGAFSHSEIELHTLPKSKAREPVWFSVYAKGDDIYIGEAKKHSPSSSLATIRRLSYPEFERMYPIFLKRKAGYPVSAEATRASHNQVYWYAIMDYCGL
jgi:hypothetical protein